MYLVKDLKYKIQIQQGVDTPADNGLLDRTYTTIAEAWAAIKNEGKFIEAIRGANTGNDIVYFIIRKDSVEKLYSGRAHPLRNDWFVFVENRSELAGRLFRIEGFRLDEKNKEFIEIKALEIEERGNGWPE